jgi:hypothetical protein
MSVGVETRTKVIAAFPARNLPFACKRWQRLNEPIWLNGRAWRLGSEPDHIGRGRTRCPEGQPLKAFDLSLSQVSTPRLLGLTPSMRLQKAKTKATTMTIERPIPPRAESVDSFSLQPPIGQRESQSLVSESDKPSDGLSRRNVLAGLAILPVVLPVTADLAADPAFAVIAEKLAADIAHCEAIDAQDEAETCPGIGSDAAEDAFQRCCVACGFVNEADWRLATTPPTTPAGVAAVLRFANQIEDGGMERPDTDAVGPDGWHYQLRATMAAAIEAIIRQQAVLS